MTLVGIVLLVNTAFVTLLFLLLAPKKRFDGIDIGWGLLFITGLLSATYVRSNDVPLGWSAYAAICMVSIWGLRLAIHIGKRFLKSKHEDQRYIQLRQSWPQKYLPFQIYVRIFLTQAILSTLVVLPALLLIYRSNQSPNVFIFTIGVTIWLIGMIIEVIADRQLAVFTKDSRNKGKLLTTGLWSKSRHPNYLGELTLWWGIGIAALSVSSGWLGLIGPLVLSFTIIKISGLPPSEHRMSLKPGWEQYKATTPIFIPFI